MNKSLIINDIYDASSSDRDWSSLSKELFEYLGADAGTLRFKSSDGRSENVFQPCDAGSDPYTNYYLHIDPIRSAIAEMRCDPKRGEAVVSVDEVVNEDLYRGSEFYQDFARHNGREHMMIGLVGDRDNTIMSFFRQDKAFGARERTALGRGSIGCLGAGGLLRPIRNSKRPCCFLNPCARLEQTVQEG